MRESTKARFLSDAQCSCISTPKAFGAARFIFDCRRVFRSEFLRKAKPHPHRWAPEAGYVTFLVDDAKDLEPAMELIRMSHQHFAAKPNVLRAEHELK